MLAGVFARSPRAGRPLTTAHGRNAAALQFTSHGSERQAVKLGEHGTQPFGEEPLLLDMKH